MCVIQALHIWGDIRTERRASPGAPTTGPSHSAGAGIVTEHHSRPKRDMLCLKARIAPHNYQLFQHSDDMVVGIAKVKR